MSNIILVLGAVVIIGGALVFISMTPDEVTTEDSDGTTSAINNTVDESDTVMDDAEVAMQDIVGVAVDTPSVSTLVAAVTAAALVDTLQSAGPFTVFAPVNDAFAALPAGTVDTLLLPENIADLQGILTYHVVAGAVLAGDLTDGMVVETVNGQSITINVSEAGGVSINGSATVIAADVMASNGVIHVIDGVLLPSSE